MGTHTGSRLYRYLPMPHWYAARFMASLRPPLVASKSVSLAPSHLVIHSPSYLTLMPQSCELPRHSRYSFFHPKHPNTSSKRFCIALLVTKARAMPFVLSFVVAPT